MPTTKAPVLGAFYYLYYTWHNPCLSFVFYCVKFIDTEFIEYCQFSLRCRMRCNRLFTIYQYTCLA